MHLIGAGDFDISAISSLPDPCPLPHNSGGIGSTTNGECAYTKLVCCYTRDLFGSLCAVLLKRIEPVEVCTRVAWNRFYRCC
jgi:hypothetical protein